MTMIWVTVTAAGERALINADTITLVAARDGGGCNICWSGRQNIIVEENIDELHRLVVDATLSNDHQALLGAFDAMAEEHAGDECPWEAGELTTELAEAWGCGSECEHSIYKCWQRLFHDRAANTGPTPA